MFTFETDRLILRTFTHDDWQDLYDYLSLDEVLKFLPKWKCTEDECKSISIKRSEDDTIWAVCLKETGKMIGHVDIRQEYDPEDRIYEIGYVFSPRYAGRGYATEACRRIIEHGFAELNAHRVIASTHVENTSSWRLLERLKMHRDDQFSESFYIPKLPGDQSIWKDEYFYSILGSEWNEN